MKLAGYVIDVDSREEYHIFEYDNKTLKWDEQKKVFKLNLDILHHGDADVLADTLSKKESFYLKNPVTLELAKVNPVMDIPGQPLWSWYVHHPDNGKESWPIEMATGLESKY
jgi:hypothetical protein